MELVAGLFQQNLRHLALDIPTVRRDSQRRVRRLAQPNVLNSAGIAAAGTALLSYPRLALWTTRQLPIWYLEAVLFFGGFVLWAFIFAWQDEFTQRPVFSFKAARGLFLAATITGAAASLCLHWFLDPFVKRAFPEDYPSTIAQWIAMILFTLGFSEVLLVYAPFAWLMRLTRRVPSAMMLTVVFGLVVLGMKCHSRPPPLWLLSVMLCVRALLAFVSVWFYARGGLILGWWLAFLIQLRLLAEVGSGSR